MGLQHALVKTAHQEYIVTLDDQFQYPSALIALHHGYLDFPSPLPSHCARLLLRATRCSTSTALKVRHACSVLVVVEAHDEEMGERGEEGDKDEGVEQGRSETLVVVACSAPFRDTVLVEEL